MTFETLLTISVLAAWTLLLGFLYRRFSSAGTHRPSALLAALAIALGLLLVIPGLLHTIAVVASAVKNDKPYDLRLVWLITLGTHAHPCRPREPRAQPLDQTR